MLGTWMPLIALVATILPLLWAKRWITRQLQELSWLWMGDADAALIIYFVIVLPGVVIHELSHWLMAWALGVPVRKLSLGPVRKGRGSRVSLGSVRVGNVDPVRSSLIGLAPLLGGSAVILLIGYLVLHVDEVAGAMTSGGGAGILEGLEQLVQAGDLGLWLYLIFAISNAMLPSESDMEAVRPVLIFLGLVAAVILLVAGVPSIPDAIAQGVNVLAGYLASAFGLTLAVDLVFIVIMLLLLWLTRWIRRK
jgi:hypothetical protein